MTKTEKIPIEWDKTYDSLRSASGGTGVSLSLLRAAKSAGCPGFKGSRVVGPAVWKWLEENPEFLTSKAGEGGDTLDSLKKELLRQNIRRAKEAADAGAIANAERRGELISRQDLEFAIPKCLAEAVSIQRKHLPTELFNVVCKETKVGFARILGEATNPTEEEAQPEAQL